MGTAKVSRLHASTSHLPYQLAAMLPAQTVSIPCYQHVSAVPYHARAGESVPAEPDAIPILNVAPLVLQRLVVGHGVECGGYLGGAVGCGGTERRPQFEFAGQAWRCGGGRRVRFEGAKMDTCSTAWGPDRL